MRGAVRACPFGNIYYPQLFSFFFFYSAAIGAAQQQPLARRMMPTFATSPKKNIILIFFFSLKFEYFPLNLYFLPVILQGEHKVRNVTAFGLVKA